jgi:hypothetical protein
MTGEGLFDATSHTNDIGEFEWTYGPAHTLPGYLDHSLRALNTR